MANWHYYNKNGEKVGPISVEALKSLVGQGLITRETLIENQTGRTALAGEVNGLIFPETTPPVTPLPSQADAEVYGLASPPSTTTPLPIPPVQSVTVPPMEVDPFTAPAPTDNNPFAASPSASTTPPTLPAPSSKIPWEAMKQNGMDFLRWALPILKRGSEKTLEVTKKVATQATEATKKAAPHVQEQVNKLPGGGKRLAMIAGAALLLLLGGVWWMSSSSRAAEQAEIDKFCAEHGTDVEATDKSGSTLLHEAAASEGVAVIVSGDPSHLKQTIDSITMTRMRYFGRSVKILRDDFLTQRFSMKIAFKALRL